MLNPTNVTIRVPKEPNVINPLLGTNHNFLGAEGQFLDINANQGVRLIGGGWFNKSTPLDIGKNPGTILQLFTFGIINNAFNLKTEVYFGKPHECNEYLLLPNGGKSISKWSSVVKNWGKLPDVEKTPGIIFRRGRMVHWLDYPTNNARSLLENEYGLGPTCF